MFITQHIKCFEIRKEGAFSFSPDTT